MRRILFGFVLSVAGACAAVDSSLHVGHLPPIPDAGAAQPKEHVALAGHVALARGQRALARGEYALAESELLRAVESLPGDASARLGLAEVWLMLGLSERRTVLLEKAKEAVDGALALKRTDARAKDIERLIAEALPGSATRP